MIKFLNKHKTQLGLTLIEALISTAIVGIGFIAVFNMVNFSVQSIDVSGERTKANYLISMIAEDIIGYKNTVYGVDAAESGISFNADGGITVDGEATTYKKFSEHLVDNSWQVGGGTTTNVCANKSAYNTKDNITNLYSNENTDAPSNKEKKWNEIFGTDRYLKCRSNKDIKNVKIFKLCKWDGCPNKIITSGTGNNEKIDDKSLFIGRVQVNLNDGKKRRFLYVGNKRTMMRSIILLSWTLGVLASTDSFDV